AVACQKFEVARALTERPCASQTLIKSGVSGVDTAARNPPHLHPLPRGAVKQFKSRFPSPPRGGEGPGVRGRCTPLRFATGGRDTYQARIPGLKWVFGIPPQPPTSLPRWGDGSRVYSV